LSLKLAATRNLAIAALLHDAVEDQGGAPTLQIIRRMFGIGLRMSLWTAPTLIANRMKYRKRLSACPDNGDPPFSHTYLTLTCRGSFIDQTIFPPLLALQFSGK